MKSNETDQVIFNQPREWNDRQTVAQACCTKLNLSIPCVVDTIDNTVDKLYAAWPERIFVIDPAGKIAYAGKQGPWGVQARRGRTRIATTTLSMEIIAINRAD